MKRFRVALLAQCFLILLSITGCTQTEKRASNITAEEETISSVQSISPATLTAQADGVNSYKQCLDPNRNLPAIACGSKDCPTGTRYLRTVNEWIAECNPADGCVDMKALGWKDGHKNRFCLDRGFAGVRPADGDYRKGGCCFRAVAAKP